MLNWKIVLENRSEKVVLEWSAEVSVSKGDAIENHAVETINYGQKGGAIQKNNKIISSGKNIGKSNETTPYEQAVFEAKSKAQKKIDQGYIDVVYCTDMPSFVFPYKGHIRPMLAHDFHDRGGAFLSSYKSGDTYIAQPKLDGVRCLARIEATPSGVEAFLETRDGKQLAVLTEIKNEVLAMCNLPGMVFDGEIYLHGRTFQEILSACKKRKPLTEKLEYHVYDVIFFDPEYKVHCNTRFDVRTKILSKELSVFSFFEEKRIKPVNSIGEFNVASEADITLKLKDAHDAAVKDGYEGLIIRRAGAGYALGDRSDALLKYKAFSDSEFKIVGGKSEIGKGQGCVVFICETEDGQRFNARPRGAVEDRKKMLDTLPDLIGKDLTVRYQGLTDDGLPRFPVGICVRDYE